MQRLEEADRNLRRLDTVLAKRELIKLPDAVPVVLAQCVEELEGLHQMHRADHHVVVPATEVVVDIDWKQPASVDAQLSVVGRSFEDVHGMAEVEQDAQVVQPNLLDGQQGTRRIRKDDLVTGVARLVIYHEFYLRM